jgi:branched-chain amino acid transport system permease protein
VVEQTLLNGLIAGAGYALFALGFGLIFQVGRFFHFAHGGIYAAGAYLAYVFSHLLGFNIWLTIPLAVCGTSLIGVLCDRMIYKPLYAANASSLVLLTASLGLFVVIQNVISLLFGDSTRMLRNQAPQQGLHILNAFITPVQIILIATSAGIAIGMWVWLKASNWGRMVRAVANDPNLCTIVGVNRDKVMVVCFAVGSGIAATGAIISGLDTDLTPMMGFRTLLFGVVAVVVGGVGSIRGAFFGGLLVGLWQHFGVLQLPTQWQDAMVFALLIIFLLVLPNGLFGKRLSHLRN